MNTKWVIVIATGMMLMTGCGNETTPTPETDTTFTQFTADETAAYWETENANAAIRKTAIDRELVVVEWRGDWDDDTRLALFRGQSHTRDVVVGKQYLDLVERLNLTLMEYTNEQWFAVANIPGNLQPGGKIVFVR